MVAEALEQRDRDRRVVDEGAVPPGARELSADDQLPLIESEPGLVQHGRRRATRRHLEHRLDGRGLGVGGNDVGMGAMTAKLRTRISRSIWPMLGQRGGHLKRYPSEYGVNAHPT